MSIGARYGFAKTEAKLPPVFHHHCEEFTKQPSPASNFSILGRQLLFFFVPNKRLSWMVSVLYVVVGSSMTL